MFVCAFDSSSQLEESFLFLTDAHYACTDGSTEFDVRLCLSVTLSVTVHIVFIIERADNNDLTWWEVL